MPKLDQLDQAAADAWDQWHDQQVKANTASKKAERAKDEFVLAFGDREKAQLPDGRTVMRIREDRSGYKVPDKTITRYILSAD
jgi:hypothetical protein